MRTHAKHSETNHARKKSGACLDTVRLPAPHCSETWLSISGNPAGWWARPRRHRPRGPLPLQQEAAPHQRPTARPLGPCYCPHVDAHMVYTDDLANNKSKVPASFCGQAGQKLRRNRPFLHQRLAPFRQSEPPFVSNLGCQTTTCFANCLLDDRKLTDGQAMRPSSVNTSIFHGCVASPFVQMGRNFPAAHFLP